MHNNGSIKLLIASNDYYPKNTPRAFRALELAKEFSKRGYIVFIYNGERNYLMSYKNYDSKVSLSLRPHKMGQKPKRSYGRIKNFIRYFLGEKDFINSRKRVQKIIDINNFDVVISIGNPFYIHYAIASLLKRKTKDIISIADCGDPFYRYKGKNLAFYFGLLQRSTFNVFDYVTIPIEAARLYYQKFCNAEKIHVIPQGFDFSDISLQKGVTNVIPKFAFAGRFYKDIRDVSPLIEILAKIDLPFMFVIYTNIYNDYYYEYLLPSVEKLRDKIEVFNLIPRKECIYELSGMDFLINLENTNDVQSPSKLIDYALSKRPILSFSHTNIPKEKLVSFIKGDYSGKMNINIENYNISNVCNMFEELILPRT